MLAICSCLMLLRHEIPWARTLALDRAGKSIAARIAIMAMTTSNSIRVKPARWELDEAEKLRCFGARLLVLNCIFYIGQQPARAGCWFDLYSLLNLHAIITRTGD